MACVTAGLSSDGAGTYPGSAHTGPACTSARTGYPEPAGPVSLRLPTRGVGHGLITGRADVGLPLWFPSGSHLSDHPLGQLRKEALKCGIAAPLRRATNGHH